MPSRLHQWLCRGVLGSAPIPTLAKRKNSFNNRKLSRQEPDYILPHSGTEIQIAPSRYYGFDFVKSQLNAEQIDKCWHQGIQAYVEFIEMLENHAVIDDIPVLWSADYLFWPDSRSRWMHIFITAALVREMHAVNLQRGDESVICVPSGMSAEAKQFFGALATDLGAALRAKYMQEQSGCGQIDQVLDGMPPGFRLRQGKPAIPVARLSAFARLFQSYAAQSAVHVALYAAGLLLTRAFGKHRKVLRLIQKSRSREVYLAQMGAHVFTDKQGPYGWIEQRVRVNQVFHSENPRIAVAHLTTSSGRMSSKSPFPRQVWHQVTRWADPRRPVIIVDLLVGFLAVARAIARTRAIRTQIFENVYRVFARPTAEQSHLLGNFERVVSPYAVVLHQVRIQGWNRFFALMRPRVLYHGSGFGREDALPAAIARRSGTVVHAVQSRQFLRRRLSNGAFRRIDLAVQQDWFPDRVLVRSDAASLALQECRVPASRIEVMQSDRSDLFTLSGPEVELENTLGIVGQAYVDNLECVITASLLAAVAAACDRAVFLPHPNYPVHRNRLEKLRRHAAPNIDLVVTRDVSRLWACAVIVGGYSTLLFEAALQGRETVAAAHVCDNFWFAAPEANVYLGNVAWTQADFEQAVREGFVANGTRART